MYIVIAEQYTITTMHGEKFDFNMYILSVHVKYYVLGPPVFVICKLGVPLIFHIVGLKLMILKMARITNGQPM